MISNREDLGEVVAEVFVLFSHRQDVFSKVSGKWRPITNGSNLLDTPPAVRVVPLLSQVKAGISGAVYHGP